MDIKCATCKELWEHFYLLNDLPWEVWDGEEGSKSEDLVKKFLNSNKGSIPKEMRSALKNERWVFGRTIVCILECCCCEDNGLYEKDEDISLRKELFLTTEELLGNDIDGIISHISSIF